MGTGEREDGVWIGRPSKWGNPFRLQDYGREEAIQHYEQYLLRSTLINEVDELREKVLFCACYPLQCHGDVLLKYIYPGRR